MANFEQFQLYCSVQLSYLVHLFRHNGDRTERPYSNVAVMVLWCRGVVVKRADS